MLLIIIIEGVTLLAALLPCLRPEHLFTHGGHGSVAFRAGVAIPDAEILAHAMGAEAAVLTAETRDEISDDATDGEILHALAIAAHDLRDSLSEESRTFVHLTFVGARRATACLFPSHKCIL